MPSGVYKRIKYHKRRLSESHLGKKYKSMSEEGRKNIGKAHKGLKVSEATKKRMSETHKRIGTGKWMKGRKLSEETKGKMRERMKGNNYAFGTKHSEEVKKRKAESQKGERSHFWRGGITKLEIYRHYKNVEYKIWRKKVFDRDNYTCLNCGISGVYLHPHHIKSYTYYPESRYDVENGITLCVPCHHQLHFGN